MGYIDPHIKEQTSSAAAAARKEGQYGQAAIALAILALAQSVQQGRP